jgi:2-succinyl-5-enolpyruvyl-6-hydroxy-3-cyclohexene-1-carboxylate synthase
MKIKVNRNILWAETFLNELVSVGIKYACISPGSRSTPLTLAAAKNKKIKSFINIDERSSAFFALGLAKSTNTPVILICTSGTATAEFYPAIIEAYQQRIPLIICTADRPSELIGVGANQTINQHNIYKNHIRWFCPVGLPEANQQGIKHIKVCARRAFRESFLTLKGPVHLNFPFKKPFEPKTYTDDISKRLLDSAKKASIDKDKFTEVKSGNIFSEKWFRKISKHLLNSKKILIIAGPENYNPDFPFEISKLSNKLNVPVLADGCSNIRFGKHKKDNILSNFDAVLRSDKFAKNNQPDFILHFGRTVTSKALETFLGQCTAPRFMINDYGDWFDPSNKSIAAIGCKPYIFCRKMNEFLDSKITEEKNKSWLNIFLSADRIASEIKRRIIENSTSLNEGRLVSVIMNLIPKNSKLMISNSMPVRDFDYFASNSEKELSVYNNRGASGIDGITSTALGIAVQSKEPTILITGDLAFYYDLNGLLAAKNFKIPLIVILVNNDGGGIFEVLPISKYGNFFKDYFIASHNLNFSHFVKAYGGKFNKIKSWNDFRTSFRRALKSKSFSVIEVKTNSKQSLKLRQKFWNDVSKKLS